MDTLRDWAKVAVAWVATATGYAMEHVTAGKALVFLTGLLTLMQCYKTWLEILQRRKQLRETDDGL